MPQQPAAFIALAFLLLLTACLLGGLIRNGWHWARIRRCIHTLPTLDKRTTAVLQEAFPILKGVTLRVCHREEPQAFTVGWRQPCIVLSPWVLENLDRQELLAAMAHELGHIRHKDNLLLFLVHSLCPGGLALPYLQRQLAHLTALLELRADTVGAALSGDRLALASALVKVRRAVHSQVVLQRPSFVGQPSLLRARIAALLAESAGKLRYREWTLLAVLAVGSVLLLSQATRQLCAGEHCTPAGMPGTKLEVRAAVLSAH
jgi:Zn-dependent protease with chaperone function